MLHSLTKHMAPGIWDHVQPAQSKTVKKVQILLFTNWDWITPKIPWNAPGPSIQSEILLHTEKSKPHSGIQTGYCSYTCCESRNTFKTAAIHEKFLWSCILSTDTFSSYLVLSKQKFFSNWTLSGLAQFSHCRISEDKIWVGHQFIKFVRLRK